MTKKITYFILAVEVLFSFCLGVYSCVNGHNLLIKGIAAFLIIISIIAIGNLFYSNKPTSKTNLVDLLVSIVCVLINHATLGLIFGWNPCPYI